MITKKKVKIDIMELSKIDDVFTDMSLEEPHLENWTIFFIEVKNKREIDKEFSFTVNLN